MLDKVLRKNIKKKKKDGEIGEHTLNEMGALNMKQKKWNKLDKRSSYSPVVFKHDCSLETYLELTWTFVFFKKCQDNSDMHLDFKKW